MSRRETIEPREYPVCDVTGQTTPASVLRVVQGFAGGQRIAENIRCERQRMNERQQVVLIVRRGRPTDPVQGAKAEQQQSTAYLGGKWSDTAGPARKTKLLVEQPRFLAGSHTPH